MKRFTIFIIILLGTLGFSVASAASFYEWSGSLNVGDEVYINNIHIKIDRDRLTNITAAIADVDGETYLIRDGEEKEIEGLTIGVKEFNDYAILSVSSEKAFTISFNATDYSAELNKLKEANEELKSENTQLKRKISDLEKQLKELSAQDVSKLQAQINNLTKENRELKAQIANQTNKYNALKAKAEFLEQQNNEYRTMIQKLLKDASSRSEQNYIEKAKKERLIGSVLVKTLIISVVVVGLIGYGLYRKKRSWEFGGL